MKLCLYKCFPNPIRKSNRRRPPPVSSPPGDFHAALRGNDRRNRRSSRHRNSSTTEIYAKVDFDGLRSLTHPWPMGGQKCGYAFGRTSTRATTRKIIYTFLQIEGSSPPHGMHHALPVVNRYGTLTIICVEC
jgi:hypothetical protein